MRFPLLRKVKAGWDEFAKVGADTHASSMAYYMFLSMVPLLALCISLISQAGVDEQTAREVILSVIPETLGDIAKRLVADAFARSGLAFSVSTLSLLWAASRAVSALRAGLNAAYGVKEDRSVLAVAVMSVMAVITLGVLIAATVWMVFGNSLHSLLSQHFPGLQPGNAYFELVGLAVTLMAGVLILGLCYTFLPAGERSYTAQLPGAACALAGCGVLSFAFHIYVEKIANTTLLYGSMATVALLLFWMYLVFYILIAGGFINRYRRRHQTSGADGAR